MSNAFELCAVSAGYPGRDVLKSIDLAVAAGERVAIVGPNGAGKSTLLRALTGIVRPAAGQVLLADVPVGELSREAVARRVAVVPQPATLPFAARVEDVVALGRLPHEDRLRGLRERDRAAVAAAVDMVGLGRLVERDARALSLGERQLVLLALAIAQKAPMVVLDEPTVHLDIRHQVDVMDLLTDLNSRDGTTIVAVMHDLRLAAHYFPRIVVLADGRVAKDATPAEALSPDVIRDVFGVDPDLLAAPWGQAATS
jgi:ABC-type cobalamin/Fe3+-siderophores transport system ATPase subunit